MEGSVTLETKWKKKAWGHQPFQMHWQTKQSEEHELIPGFINVESWLYIGVVLIV